MSSAHSPECYRTLAGGWTRPSGAYHQNEQCREVRTPAGRAGETPALLPLGEVDGRRIGLVVEAEVVEAASADEDGEKVN